MSGETKTGWIRGGNANEHDPDKSDCWYIYDQGESRIVAKVFHEPDADIITAAPDLYKALKGLLGAYDAVLDQLANIPPTDHPGSWRAIAAAALAKAAPPNRPTP